MDCRQVNEELSAYLDGELGKAQTQAVAAHLERCDNCRRELHELRRLAGLVRALPQHKAPESLAYRVVAGIEAAATRRTVVFRYVRILWPAAAAAMIALTIHVFYRQEEESLRPVAKAPTFGERAVGKSGEAAPRAAIPPRGRDDELPAVAMRDKKADEGMAAPSALPPADRTAPWATSEAQEGRAARALVPQPAEAAHADKLVAEEAHEAQKGRGPEVVAPQATPPAGVAAAAAPGAKEPSTLAKAGTVGGPVPGLPAVPPSPAAREAEAKDDLALEVRLQLLVVKVQQPVQVAASVREYLSGRRIGGKEKEEALRARLAKNEIRGGGGAREPGPAARSAVALLDSSAQDRTARLALSRNDIVVELEAAMLPELMAELARLGKVEKLAVKEGVSSDEFALRAEAGASAAQSQKPRMLEQQLSADTAASLEGPARTEGGAEKVVVVIRVLADEASQPKAGEK